MDIVKYPEYSVLMSVYKKENPDHLRLAMNSMWEQSVVTDDFVLICDGKLTEELDNVIDEMKASHQGALNVVRFEENQGLGHALRTGVAICKNELIARMDSDDISLPSRCEKELEVLAAHPELSICGSVIEEFSDSPGDEQINSRRVVPEKQEDIIRFAKSRNPFNHPSVMFRKQAVLDAGNYPEVRFMQDYYLWAKMLIAGYKGYNIQEPLVRMRADNGLFKRRSGKLYRNIQLGLFRYMKDEGFITKSQYAKSCIVRVGSSAAPNSIRKFMFKKILRK